MEFLELPVELIERILIICDPIDASKVAQTCSFLHSLIYLSENSTLWRELYLMQELDDPRECVGHDGRVCPQIDWRKELQCVIRARTVLENPSRMRGQELECILETLIRLVCYLKPWTSSNAWIPGLSKNLEWVAKGLRGGLLDRIQAEGKLGSIDQQVARLHTYYGLTKSDIKRKKLAELRAFVYLLRNYLPENEYGPFMPDGTVNWVHLCAIRHVISAHLLTIDDESNWEEFDNKNLMMSLAFTQTILPKDVDLDVEQDWAGITGTWTVAFCFCDHRQLIRFNEISVEEVETAFFEQPNDHEAYRWLDIELCVTKTEPDPCHPTRPVIHFFGEMNSPATTMAGRISMTRDNQVQWHFVSGEQGDAIWSSSGVQVGGLGSFYGVLGSWTTIFHDTDDPVGPFWMRKRRFKLR